jgi:hypothetical protein
MKPKYKVIDLMGLISLQGQYSDMIAIHNLKTIIENKDSNKEMKQRYLWLKKNHPELII